MKHDETTWEPMMKHDESIESASDAPHCHIVIHCPQIDAAPVSLAGSRHAGCDAE